MAKKNSYNYYLNLIAEKVFESQDLCKYLYYDSDKPLSESNISDPEILYTDKNNQRIFFEPFTLNVDDERLSRLSIMLKDINTDHINYFRSVNIECMIVCHNDIWQLETSDFVSSRPLLILDELDYIFDQKFVAGVGSEKTYSSNLIYYNENFTGYAVSYMGINLPIQRANSSG